MARYHEKKDNEYNGKVERFNPSNTYYRIGKDGKTYESKSYRTNPESESECDEYAKKHRQERLDYIQSPDGQLDKIKTLIKRKRSGLDNTEYTKSNR